MAEEVNRRDDIIAAALEVFAEVGYAKATIKQIAERAQVKSPALIYWYFKNKQELLQAALGSVAPVITQVTMQNELLDLPPQQMLPHLASLIFAALENPASGRLMRLFMSEAIHNPASVEEIASSGPRMVLDLLRRYFARQIERGTVRPHDPEVSARVLISTLLVYLLARDILTPMAAGMPPPQEYAQQAVSIVLNGLMPDAPSG